ncbi:hypothetical protein [Sphingopyxis witflariensis]|uniref:Uncharacterized protein n=1 Tax=Sphingopyxis witflariensis TaxID=173675 RepID=A0A246JY61_9SPHN|nr:hypothetical protein [Sphingopyxis witflariensis]OWQ97999.1 hypothetical protein CDQ91_10285 [Sphingopyxis witflariensis]
MADQSVRVIGDSGSPEAVAYRLWERLRIDHDRRNSLEQDLGLFTNCLKAAKSQSYDVSQPT